MRNLIFSSGKISMKIHSYKLAFKYSKTFYTLQQIFLESVFKLFAFISIFELKLTNIFL